MLGIGRADDEAFGSVRADQDLLLARDLELRRLETLNAAVASSGIPVDLLRVELHLDAAELFRIEGNRDASALLLSAVVGLSFLSLVHWLMSPLFCFYAT